MSLNKLGQLSHETARAKGFWEDALGAASSPVQTKLAISTKLALVAAEAIEALEAFRAAPENVEAVGEELADVVIRAVDIAGFLKIDLDRAVEAKMVKNKTRPYKHGKAF